MAILYQTSSFFQGWVMTWVGALEWIKPTAGIKEKDVVVLSHDQRKARGWGTGKVSIIEAS